MKGKHYVGDGTNKVHFAAVASAFRAACGYSIDKNLKNLNTPLTVFAPHDDIIEQTQRVKPLLKSAANYVDLPDLGQDLFHRALDRMVMLLNRHLPP